MKLSGKPVSSPGRTDKFPPPLMRFLRSNAGSKSRRSRSSPMFLRKKTTTNIQTQTTQEPSSPKVTCMGQVRVKRSSNTKRDVPPTRCRCRWVPKSNPCRYRPFCLTWPFFRRKSKQHSRPNHHQESESASEERTNADKNIVSFASNPSTPPKNALLLTRCRSAPYRSSSLACRFWSSPVKDQETDFPDTEPASEEPQTDTKLGFLGTKIASLTHEEKVEELSSDQKGVELVSAIESRPSVLTRCKSEPARTGHRIDPLVNNLWKKRRNWVGLFVI
ncbi:hypothetical protein VIGAN_04326300 [Vigna angularis var. angularis]|uniref:Uncharacterized protein n=1 Tax=Vigna angularis var. angularis TaxID=157739 RepID=A0A0S3RYL6_PHAAN|nr:hypothetical protein VIGAN_04326300 [Vigna angularis var. angularis]